MSAPPLPEPAGATPPHAPESAAAQSAPAQSAITWFGEFLRRELAPFPGRASLVTRMVLGATLTMLIIMTFHLPGGALGGYYALVISRESLRNTVQQTWLTIAFFCLATLYVLLGIALFVDSPVTHFLWVIGSFYLIFFVMGTAKNYGLAAGFSFLIATAIPIWDRAGEVNIKVALTLYTLLSVIIGALSTLFVEAVYRSFHPEDPVLAGIADRLHVAGLMLRCAAEGESPAKADEARLLQYAMVGPSGLRRQLIRAGITAEERARVSAVVALSGRLVELCAAALDGLAAGRLPDTQESRRLRALGETVLAQAAGVKALPDINRIGSSSLPGWDGSEAASDFLPILPEIERGVALLSDIFNSFGIVSEQQEALHSGADEARSRARIVLTMLGSNPREIFSPDAFSNREHLVFALRGCLATTLCYVVYNGIDWPGINTSVATCIITALGTVGSSRQKQLLRLSGAIVGGFFISLPAQVFLLPYMDSITAFTLFFIIVSAVAAWFATSSPRLSYFGLQIALAFYLVNLQEPFEQISLAVARDRVVGVLFGLVAMWLVFDQFAAPRATERMGSLLARNLQMLGDLVCAIATTERHDSNPAMQQLRQLRESINDGFSQMNAQADAVQFEFGPRRALQLRERERMQRMQPAMRSLFLLDIALFESDQLPAGARGSFQPGRVPALQRFLDQNRSALHTIAALQVAGITPAPGAQSATVADADQAVAATAGALAEMRQQVGDQDSPLLTLCTSMVSSVDALKRAATESIAV